MSIRSSETGIGHVLVLLLVLVVLGAIGFAGYTVWQAGQDNTTTTSQTDSFIKTEEDLQDASASLDSLEADLDKDLDTSSLDSDIEQLL